MTIDKMCSEAAFAVAPVSGVQTASGRWRGNWRLCDPAVAQLRVRDKGVAVEGSLIANSRRPIIQHLGRWRS